MSVVATLTLPGTPAQADSVRDRAWHLSALGLPELHKVTQGEGITVAVVDTGVDATHPDLKGNVLPGVDLHDDRAKGQVDRVGHGTAMASLIAGHGHGPGNGDGVLGIAPKAKILPVTIQRAKQGIIAPDAVAVGIDWAVDHGADVINVSVSSSFDDDIDRAVERAYAKGVIVVAAVGNRENLLIGSPAHHPGAMAVTGTGRGGRLGPESIPAEQTDIAAPSVELTRAEPGGKYSTITSVSGATAIVSGAVALVRAKYPNLSARDMFKRVLETTKDEGEPGHDEDYGWGVLDLRAALTGEPDGRADRKPSASAEPPPAGAWEEGEPDKWWYPVVGIPVLLLIVATPIALIVFLVRRRRKKRVAAATPAPAVVPNQPLPPSATSDDSAWRRPSS